MFDVYTRKGKAYKGMQNSFYMEKYTETLLVAAKSGKQDAKMAFSY